VVYLPPVATRKPSLSSPAASKRPADRLFPHALAHLCRMLLPSYPAPAEQPARVGSVMSMARHRPVGCSCSFADLLAGCAMAAVVDGWLPPSTAGLEGHRLDCHRRWTIAPPCPGCASCAYGTFLGLGHRANSAGGAPNGLWVAPGPAAGLIDAAAHDRSRCIVVGAEWPGCGQLSLRLGPITACCHHQMAWTQASFAAVPSPVNRWFSGPSPFWHALAQPRLAISFLRSGTRPMVRPSAPCDLPHLVGLSTCANRLKSEYGTCFHAAALPVAVRKRPVISSARAGMRWR